MPDWTRNQPPPPAIASSATAAPPISATLGNPLRPAAAPTSVSVTSLMIVFRIPRVSSAFAAFPANPDTVNEWLRFTYGRQLLPGNIFHSVNHVPGQPRCSSHLTG